MQHFNTAELCNPTTGAFTPTGSMAAARRAHVSVLLSTGKVLIAGGTDGQALTSAELYDPASGRFTPTGSLSVGRGANGGRIQAVVLPSGEVLIPGAPPDPSEIYNPNTGTWRKAASMLTARIGYSAALLPSGHVLVAGGSPGPLASSEIYDPLADRWSPAGDMQTGRGTPAGVALPNGAVLVTGGVFENPSVDLFEEPPPAMDAGAPSDAAAPSDAPVNVLPDAPLSTADGSSSVAAEESGCGCRLGGRRSAPRPSGAVAALLLLVGLGALRFAVARSA
jgi:hypothetical protein